MAHTGRKRSLARNTKPGHRKNITVNITVIGQNIARHRRILNNSNRAVIKGNRIIVDRRDRHTKRGRITAPITIRHRIGHERHRAVVIGNRGKRERTVCVHSQRTNTRHHIRCVHIKGSRMTHYTKRGHRQAITVNITVNARTRIIGNHIARN